MKLASLRQLCAAGLWAVSGLALAQTVVFSENFDAAGADAPAGLGTTGPAGWTLRLENADTVATSGRSSAAKLPWLGWKFVTPTYWTTQVSGGDRAKLTKANGKIAVAESDGLRPNSGLYFSTVMESPSIAVLGGGSYTLGFLSHFQMGSTKKESIKVEAVFDDSSVQTLLHETSASRLNQNENLAFSVPAGAKKVSLRFSYLNTDNNWYWGLDDVVLTQTSSEPPKPFDPAKLPNTANAPALTVGPTLQNPGPDHMAVMLETTESAPTIWWRLAGSTGPYTLLPAKNPVGDFADSSIFFADIAGLQSNTLYEYAVVTGSSAAPKLAGPFQFKTCHVTTMASPRPSSRSCQTPRTAWPTASRTSPKASSTTTAQALQPNARSTWPASWCPATWSAQAAPAATGRTSSSARWLPSRPMCR